MKRKTSFTLSEIARKLLFILASQDGLSMAAWVETVIREKARIRGIGSDELGKVEWKPEEKK